jgi:predicted RNA binding protein YcfA (HicA-like mRNA interferase family)
MPKVPYIRAREAVRVAESIAFIFDCQKGSHAVYYRAPDNRRGAEKGTLIFDEKQR